MPRLTLNIINALVALLHGPDRGLYGLELGKAARMPPGSIYVTIDKMIEAGWVTKQQEHGDPAQLGRPLRTFYKLTGAGAAVAIEARDQQREIHFGSDGGAIA